MAVTRGMALCVVVGQPHLLYSDLHWRALLKYCIAHGICLFTHFTSCCLTYLTHSLTHPTCTVGAYTGMDIDHFMRRNRSRAGSVDMGTESGDREDLPHTEEASVEQLLHGVPGNATFMYDQEDEDLLNSVTEVANNMLMGESPLDSILKGSAVLGVLGAASRQGHYVRGYDMEWRNIL